MRGDSRLSNRGNLIPVQCLERWQIAIQVLEFNKKTSIFENASGVIGLIMLVNVNIFVSKQQNTATANLDHSLKPKVPEKLFDPRWKNFLIPFSPDVR